jgi:hypothetical protein
MVSLQTFIDVDNNTLHKIFKESLLFPKRLEESRNDDTITLYGESNIDWINVKKYIDGLTLIPDYKLICKTMCDLFEKYDNDNTHILKMFDSIRINICGIVCVDIINKERNSKRCVEIDVWDYHKKLIKILEDGRSTTNEVILTVWLSAIVGMGAYYLVRQFS